MHAVPATPEGAAERWQRRHCVAVRQAVRKTAVYQAWHFLFGKSPVARHHSRAGVSVGARQRVLRYAAPRARHEQSHTGGLEELLPRHLWRALSRANPVVVGGPGIVVEIDESLFCRRKYNVGRLVREQWVFGGIEVGTPDKKAFLVAVPRRDAATLLPIITRYVAPGSTIISDCWRAYNTLGLQGYTHLTVNHSINFVDPNTGACTNHIENYWQHAKQRNKREYGTARTQLDSYLIEYMWRARYHKNMQTFIEHVRAVYPPH